MTKYRCQNKRCRLAYQEVEKPLAPSEAYKQGVNYTCESCGLGLWVAKKKMGVK
jgi:hypothetical protein